MLNNVIDNLQEFNGKVLQEPLYSMMETIVSGCFRYIFPSIVRASKPFLSISLRHMHHLKLDDASQRKIKDHGDMYGRWCR